MTRLAQSYYQSGTLCSPYSGMWTEGSKTVLKCSSFPSGSPQVSEGAVTSREGSHCKLVMTSTVPQWLQVKGCAPLGFHLCRVVYTRVGSTK